MVVGIRQTISDSSTGIVVSTAPCLPGGVLVVMGIRRQHKNHHDEQRRQADQHDVQRDFVGRLLPARPFDHGNHAVQKRIAGLGGHADHDPVAQTRVPPVTALRSPPLSRTTGADSPVMADSSTVAMPSTISPSAANDLAGLADEVVADLQLAC